MTEREALYRLAACNAAYLVLLTRLGVRNRVMWRTSLGDIL